MSANNISLIRFFDPVNYKGKATSLQRALEYLDEYFYLGGRYRVTIFTPNTGPRTHQARENQRGCHRSWINVAIKVASYCTVIFPLIALSAKAMLRSYLQVSSLTVESSCSDLTTLQARIENCDRSKENLQDFLVELVTTPIIGEEEYWIPSMRAWMKHAEHQFLRSEFADRHIQKHKYTAELLATSGEQILPYNIHKFCQYLIQEEEEMASCSPWHGYRCLEQYLQRPELDSEAINEAIKEYFTQKVKDITVSTQAFIQRPEVSIQGFIQRPEQKFLPYKTARINFYNWFGPTSSKYNLWRQDVCMPKLLLEALLTHVQSLHDSDSKPFMFIMTKHADANVPEKFLLPLAKGLTDKKIVILHSLGKDSVKSIKEQDYAIEQVEDFYKTFLVHPRS